jgi:hypothetical protein
MKHLLACATLFFAMAIASVRGGELRGSQAQLPAKTPTPDPAFLAQYCVTCHNDRLKTGGLALDGFDVAQAGSHADVWEKVVRKLRTGMMPPEGAKKPTDAVRESFTS